MRFLPLLLFIVLAQTYSSAQELSLMNVPVTIQGNEMKYPWIGGLKAPQFSEADLDNDGILDLFIFDKTGNVILTFKNNGTPNQIDYEYAPELAEFFPALKSWALLRDYNGDGIVDIFTQHQNLGFSAVEGIAIPIPSIGPLFTQLYVSSQDVPAILDYDDDGDIDILTFAGAGGYVHYYQNKAVEEGLGLEEFKYELVDDCWGKFLESGITECLTLSANPNECEEVLVGDPIDRNSRHAGSTILVLDEDGDGDKDMLLGDISFNSILLAKNSPNNNSAYVEDQDCTFPSYNISVDLITFPAPFYVDVDNNGKKDLLVGINRSTGGEDLQSIWRYSNLGTNDNPNFQFEQSNFLLDNCLDLGNGANPTFVDVNADGLLDIVAGNNNYFVPGGSSIATISLFENTGTTDSPAFTLIDDDWLGFGDLFLNSPNNFGFNPSFADMDSDGDMDFLCGDNSGGIIYMENIADAGNPMSLGPLQFNWQNMKVGSKSTPTAVDINRDGLLDLVVGENTVNFIDYTDTASSFNLFINTGTAQDPIFSPNPSDAPNFDFFGFAVTRDQGFNTGESAPAFIDTGDDYIMLSGSSSGRIKVYDNIENNIYGRFDTVSENYGGINHGISSRIAIADVDSDGILEMAVGNRRGGLSFYKTDYHTDGSSVAIISIPEMKAPRIFPNPTTDQLTIEFVDPLELYSVELYTTLGGAVLFSEKDFGSRRTISLTNFPAGIYFVKVTDEQGRIRTEKIIKY